VQGLSSTEKDGSASGFFAEHAWEPTMPFDRPEYRLAVVSLKVDTDRKKTVIQAHQASQVQSTKQEVLL
jgi:hypothetical protein